MRSRYWLSIAVCLLIVPQAEAQTVLRWKLNEGDEFVVRTRQQTQSNVAFSSKSAQSSIEMQIDIRWKVQQASDESFAIVQTIERLAASLTTANGSAQFDSAAKGRPIGLAKQLSDALQPLVGAQISIEMNPRGQVHSARPANAAAEALFKSHQPDAAKKVADTIKQVVSQSILQFPEEELTTGGKWETARELQTPAGPLKQTTTYTVEEISDRDGKPVCRIESQSTLEQLGQPAPADGKGQAAITLKDRQQQGTIWFAIDQGRVVESKQTQKLVTERAYRDTTITVTLESTQTTQVE